MVCTDCDDIKDEVVGLRTFLNSWFLALMGKFDTHEKRLEELLQLVSDSEGIPDESPSSSAGMGGGNESQGIFPPLRNLGDLSAKSSSIAFDNKTAEVIKGEQAKKRFEFRSQAELRAALLKNSGSVMAPFFNSAHQYLPPNFSVNNFFGSNVMLPPTPLTTSAISGTLAQYNNHMFASLNTSGSNPTEAKSSSVIHDDSSERLSHGCFKDDESLVAQQSPADLLTSASRTQRAMLERLRDMLSSAGDVDNDKHEELSGEGPGNFGCDDEEFEGGHDSSPNDRSCGDHFDADGEEKDIRVEEPEDAEGSLSGGPDSGIEEDRLIIQEDQLSVGNRSDSVTNHSWKTSPREDISRASEDDAELSTEKDSMPTADQSPLPHPAASLFSFGATAPQLPYPLHQLSSLISASSYNFNNRYSHPIHGSVAGPRFETGSIKRSGGSGRKSSNPKRARPCLDISPTRQGLYGDIVDSHHCTRNTKSPGNFSHSDDIKKEQFNNLNDSNFSVAEHHSNIEKSLSIDCFTGNKPSAAAVGSSGRKSNSSAGSTPKPAGGGSNGTTARLPFVCEPGELLTDDNVCTICGKKLSMRGNGLKHVKLHIFGKTLQCPHCPNKFSQSSNLKNHILARHLKEPKREGAGGAGRFGHSVSTAAGGRYSDGVVVEHFEVPESNNSSLQDHSFIAANTSTGFSLL